MASSTFAAKKTVVFVRTGVWPAAEQAFVDELGTQTFQLKVVDGTKGKTGCGDSLSATSVENGEPDLWVCLGSTNDGLHLEIVEGRARGHNRIGRMVPLDGAPSQAALEFLLIGCVEEIHSALSGLDRQASWTGQPRSEGPSDAGAVLPTPSTSRVGLSRKETTVHERMSLGLGGALLWSPGGVAPMFGPVGQLGVPLPFGLVAFAMGGVAFLGGKVSGGVSTSELDGVTIRMGLSRILFKRRRFRILFGGRGGWFLVRLLPATRDHWERVALIGVAARVRLGLAHRLGVVLGIGSDWVLPQIEVRQGEKSVAHAGRPMLSGSILLDLRL